MKNCESAIQDYPDQLEVSVINETEGIVNSFAERIRSKAIETDARLRSSGGDTAKLRDLGNWFGSTRAEIRSLSDGIRQVYPLSGQEEQSGLEIPTPKIPDVKIVLGGPTASVNELLPFFSHYLWKPMSRFLRQLRRR